ncbi:MAG: HNH endonuclease [Anaerolineales bacterium]|nr:HNH endonuclease [Anaerolineales bacterium]
MQIKNTSKYLFQQLSKKLRKTIAGLSISETDKWCSFHQSGGKKFAYFLLAKRKPKIDVWCIGNPEYIKSKYSTNIKFATRQKTTGGFGKSFQIHFLIEDQEDIEKAFPLLSEVSNSWSKEELMLAFNLYCKIPISQIDQYNKNIIEFASLLGKTPKDIVKRFLNFSKLEASTNSLGNIEGFEDRETWAGFHNNWEKSIYESESHIIDLEYKNQGNTEFPKGKERQIILESRVNQGFFRSIVLSSYDNKCCITQLPFTELLNASHIIPWAIDPEIRLNPHNGLCLNALHDRAFDRGLITITPNYIIKISPYISDLLDDVTVSDLFIRYQNQKIFLPDRFTPEKLFLEYHNKKVFKK